MDEGPAPRLLLRRLDELDAHCLELLVSLLDVVAGERTVPLRPDSVFLAGRGEQRDARGGGPACGDRAGNRLSNTATSHGPAGTSDGRRRSAWMPEAAAAEAAGLTKSSVVASVGEAAELLCEVTHPGDLVLGDEPREERVGIALVVRHHRGAKPPGHPEPARIVGAVRRRARARTTARHRARSRCARWA